MELFSINRYDGNEEQRDGAQEGKKLENLLKKVAKRKRKLEQQKTQPNEEYFQEEEIADKKLKEQSKCEVEATENSTSSEIVQKPEAPPEDELPSNFQVLGTDTFEKRQEAQMVLPPWLQHPTIIVNEISTASGDLDEFADILLPILVKNMKSQNITKLFPVQKEVIPWMLTAHAKPHPFRPRDICVSAPTGSGKTLAFAVPIVQLLMKRVECKVRALVILPATELADQVFKVFKALVRNTELRIGLLSNAMPFVMEQKIIVEKFQGKYYSKVDIIVATPGRLVEHLHSTDGLDLKALRFLVIDEADRIMEQSYQNWVYHLDQHLKTTNESFMTGRPIPLCYDQLVNVACKMPHKMLFSATLSQDPEKLQDMRLFQPKLFTSIVNSAEEFVDKVMENVSKKHDDKEQRGDFVGKYTTPAELTEYCVVTESRLKPLTLFALIVEHKWKRFLCFTNSTQATHRLAIVLDNLAHRKFKVADLSSALKPGERKKVLKSFAAGEFTGLVCSDALTRGIDIKNVDVVISYEAPRHVKTYIHRVGRTARAGQRGIAVTILTSSEVSQFKRHLRVAGKAPLEELKSDAQLEEKYAHHYTKALSTLQDTVAREKNLSDIRQKLNKGRMRAVSKAQNNIMNSLQEQIESQINASEKIKPPNSY